MSELEKIKNILQEHCGRSNKIKSREVADMMGYAEDDTHAGTRDLIRQAAEQYKLPLVADSAGYYLISDEKDYLEYMDNLDKRIRGIEERKAIITANYKEWNK